MEVDYKLTVADWWAFVVYHKNHGPQQPRQNHASNRLVKIFGVICVIAMATMLFLDKPMRENLMNSLVIRIGGVVVLVTLLVFLILFVIRRRAMKEYLGKLPAARITINKEGLRQKTPVTETMYLWAGILAVGVTNEYFFLYTRMTQAIIIPAHAFTDTAAFNAFVDQAHDYLEADNAAHFSPDSGSQIQAIQQGINRKQDFRTTTSASPSGPVPKA